jgi:hypothetical protein
MEHRSAQSTALACPNTIVPMTTKRLQRAAIAGYSYTIGNTPAGYIRRESIASAGALVFQGRDASAPVVALTDAPEGSVLSSRVQPSRAGGGT